MSVVIIGGNECMERRYKDLCDAFQCQAKVFTKPRGGLKDKLGCPDLMVCFTDTMSHKDALRCHERAEREEHYHRAFPQQFTVSPPQYSGEAYYGLKTRSSLFQR